MSFSWKALQSELSMSPYFDPTCDDITSQRGIVATSVAILERMSNSERMREVTWKPSRLLDTATKPIVTATPKQPKRPSGNAPIVNPVPLPVVPGCNGAKVSATSNKRILSEISW